MHKTLIALAALAAASPALPQASAAIASGKAQPSPLAPSEIVAQAPKADWTAIAASDLLVMDLAPDAKGKPRRVVIQLMPAPFSQGWIGNIRKLAAARFWDGTAVNRVQDNYVVQWGDPNAEDKAKAKPLPTGLAVMSESDYVRTLTSKQSEKYESQWNKRHDWELDQIGSEKTAPDPATIPPYSEGMSSYALVDVFENGWPTGVDTVDNIQAPVHCYGMVGVGRDLSPNTGSGAELYVGHLEK
ncbi:MAG: peptidylprolyl isomerase [Novosphingobium sp.]|nr:peptidylprolyl isomerase [Novosphingobium sp.]